MSYTRKATVHIHQRPERPSLAKISEDIVSLGNSLAGDAEAYQASKTAKPDLRMPALQARIADLEQELTVARAELTELEREGTPKEKLIRNACLAEKSVQGLASSLKVALVHDASMRTYGVGPSHLPKTATDILASSTLNYESTTMGSTVCSESRTRRMQTFSKVWNARKLRLRS